MKNIEKLTPGTHQSVIDVIEKYNWNVIDNKEDVLNLFDPETLRNEKPTINSDSNAIIIFDNPNHNSAFLHEYFDAVLSNRENIGELLEFPKDMPIHLLVELQTKLQTKLNIICPTIKVYYCNNEALNEYLFKPFFESIFKQIQKNALDSGDTNNPVLKQKFDYDCPPVILSINKKQEMIMIEYEKMFPMNLHSVFSQYIIIHDAEYVKEVHNNQKLEAQKSIEKESIDKYGAQPIPAEPKIKA